MNLIKKKNKIEQGKVLAQGSPVDLAKSGIDFVELIGDIKTIDTENNGEKHRLLSQRSQTISMRSTSIESLGSIAEMQIESEQSNGVGLEASSKGKIKGSLTVKYFKAGAHWCILSLLLVSFVFVQMLASAADYWVSVW